MRTAPIQISEIEAMNVKPDTVKVYLYELETAGLIYRTTEGMLKVTPETSSNFKDWVKTNGHAPE